MIRQPTKDSHILPRASIAKGANPVRVKSQSTRPIIAVGPIRAIDGDVGFSRVGPSARENPRAAAATAKIQKADNAIRKKGLMYAPKVPVQVRFCMDLDSLRNANARV
jgi:hypothetical protein